MAPFHLNVIRTAFALGEHVAPAFAGRAAFELFCRTPNPRKLSTGERRAGEAAAGLMAEARVHRLYPQECKPVVAYEFRPVHLEPAHAGPRETVLVLHGWRSRTEYMQALIAAFVGAGFRVISLDLPGHGASSGRRLNMAVAVRAVRHAADWFGPFTAIVGHSFGGALAINAAAGSVVGVDPVEAGSVVTIASPSSMPGVFSQIGKMLGVGPRAEQGVHDQIRAVAGRPFSFYESAQLLARLPVPTLAIHDEDDREVSVSENKILANIGPHVTTKLTKGLGHRRIIADAGVIGSAVDFVVRQSLRRVH